VNRFRPRLVAVAAGVLMVSTVLVGLTSTGPVAAATSAPVKVGIICSCTGPLASSIAVGPPAYKAWADYQNSIGGIDGHKVDVIVDDDAFNSGTSLTDAENLISQDKVAAIVDASDVDAAWGTYVKQQGVPVVGGGSSSQLFLTNDDFFAVGQTLTDYFVNFMLSAKKLGKTHFGELYCAEAATCEEGVPPLKKTAAALHMTLTYVTQISASAPNYTAQCLAAKQAGVQALTVADAVSVVEAVASDCVAQGYSPVEIALDGGVAKSFTSSPGLDSGQFIGSEPDVPFFTDDTSATKQMNANLKKYADSTLTSPNWNEEGTQLYLSGLLLAAAAQADKAGSSGPITPAEVTDGLYDLHGETLNGMTPPLTFAKGKPTPVDCWYWIRIQTKKFTTPYGVSPVCEKPPPGTLT
jgi:branched-chain amino acid transport system substrate-binding protein